MPRKVDYIHYPNNVRITREPDTRGMYRVRFTKADGRPGEARRGSWAEADHLARELADIADQPHLAHDDHGRTVADAVELFLSPTSHDEPLSDSYLRNVRLVAARSITPIIGDVRLSDWQLEHSQKVLDSCRQRGLAGSTTNTTLRILSTIASHALSHGWLPSGARPCDGLKRPRTKGLDLSELPDKRDVEKVAMGMADATLDETRALMVYAAAYSGLRVSEVLGLVVGDVDLDAGTIRVERQLAPPPGRRLVPPKSGEPRTTVFPAWLDEAWALACEGRPADSPIWVSSTGDHVSHDDFRRGHWEPAMRAAGWQTGDGWRWRFHDLRHYFCTWALASEGLGLDVADVSRFAGHANPQITWQVYVQSRPDRVARARQASRGAGR